MILCNKFAPMAPEPLNWTYHAFCIVSVMVLMGAYFFGVWLRSHVWKGDNSLSFGNQLLIAVPVSLITMGLYAKSVITAMPPSPDTIDFDAFVAFDNATVLGMLSRESLERILKGASPILSGHAGPELPVLTDSGENKRTSKGRTKQRAAGVASGTEADKPKPAAGSVDASPAPKADANDLENG
jgi:hypothetical protein